jgi:hypothetical protein
MESMALPAYRFRLLFPKRWFDCYSLSPLLGLSVCRWVKRNGEQLSHYAPLAVWLMHLRRCNKNYKKGSPIVPPGGQFPVPATSDSTLLAFRCTPIYKPYITEDMTSNGGFIVDTLITHTQVRGAMPIALESSAKFLFVSISVGDDVLAVSQVPVNTTKFEIPFSLTKLVPRKEPYAVSCSATYRGDQRYTANASLSYLPNPVSGSITKLDARTGGLWTKPFDAGYATGYTPVLPLGFYTSFDDYLAKNLSILDDLKARGYVHGLPKCPTSRVR